VAVPKDDEGVDREVGVDVGVGIHMSEGQYVGYLFAPLVSHPVRG
jgi:hypothetical protein